MGLIPVHRLASIYFCTLFLGLLSLRASYAGTPRFLENGTPGPPTVQGTFLGPSATRFRTSLNGQWNYLHEAGGSATITIPVAFDGVGSVDFQRTVEIPPEQLDRFRWQLVVYGSNYATDVTFNGDFLGTHQGGYTSFAVQIPQESLQPGRENTLHLVVNNTLNALTTMPLRQLVWGWKNYGGIHRDIALLATPPLFVRDVRVTSTPIAPSGTFRLSVEPSIEGQIDSIKQILQQDKKAVLGFHVEVVETLSGAVLARSPIQPLTQQRGLWTGGVAEAVVQNPKLWSPETPDMYTVRCLVTLTTGRNISLIDEYIIPYGFRTLEIGGADFLLNGRRLLVRGVSWFEDHPVWGNAIPYEERERDIVMIKLLGANLVRFVHHPPDPVMLDLCDRYGLLVMVDLPLTGSPAAVLAGETYLETATNMLREMILRDRHHPSVLAWGIGDEIESSPEATRPFMQVLSETARALDQRPLYIPSRLGVPDSSLASVSDIAAVNVYQHDLKVLKSALEEWRSSHKAKPMLVTALGMEVDHENRNGYNDPLSQQAQARFFLQRLDLLRMLDFDGVVITAFNDWRGDRPALTVHTGDPWMHRMGLVSDRREKRLAYDAVRAVFRGEKAAPMPAGSHSMGAPIVYVLSGFVILIAVAYLYNASRRFREHVNRSLMSSFNFFADVRDQHGISVIHTTFLALIVSVASAIVFSSLLFHFRDSLFLDNLLSYVLVFDSLKAYVVRLVWEPLDFILLFGLLFFVVLVLLSGAVHALRILIKGRVFAFHSYTVTVWSATPLLAFIPLGMILYRVMEARWYVVPSLVIVTVFFVWVFARLLKGISIIYEVYPPKLYAAGIVAVGALAGLLWLYYDIVQSAPMYLSFLYSMVGSGR